MQPGEIELEALDVTDPASVTRFANAVEKKTAGRLSLLINNAVQYDFTGSDHDLTRVHQGWGRPAAGRPSGAAVSNSPSRAGFFSRARVFLES